MRKFLEILSDLDDLRKVVDTGRADINVYKAYISTLSEINLLLDRDSLRERRSIEDSKQFARSTEKTQVMVPQTGLDEIVKNRATHSYETTTSSLVIAVDVAEKSTLQFNDVDYMRSIYNVALSHDIGHPPFGHDGQEFIHDYFKMKGLEEGFDDNNNNLVVIEKNNIKVRDYTLASIIKYPTNLYSSQKEKYSKLLETALGQDLKHFSQFGIILNNQSKTIACQIMDEADRNSYTCSDLSDFLCMGNQLESHKVLEIAERYNIDGMVDDLLEVANSGDKNTIKEYFSSLKESFNLNHGLNSSGLHHIDKNLLRMREFLSKLSKVFYIEPLREMDFHKENMEKLKFFVNEVVNNDFHPSTYYRKKIESATNKQERLTALRDMISEVSDWYVINTYDKLVKEKAKNRDLDDTLSPS